MKESLNRMLDDSTPVPIAFCITELDRGGAERALCNLVLGLDRSSWNPRVYCLGPPGYFTEILESRGIFVNCFHARGLTSFPRILVELTKALREFRPALLQTFLFHGNLAGRFAGRLAGIPKIVSGIRVAERRSRWYGRLDRWTNGLVDQNVCVSQGVADFSLHSTGLSASKLIVIPNGVDPNTIANAQPVDLSSLGIRSDSPLVITIGRLEEQKGISYLLQAAVEILKKHPDCHFLIVGEGPDRASLEQQARKLGISLAVHFTGGRPDVPGLLKSACTFVLPSLWEGMPNALLEAMAAGLPVIATSVEGSREVVQSGINGVLVEPARSDALSQAILMVLNDSTTAAALGREAQNTILKNFTTNAMIRAYEDLYRNLICRN